MTDEGFFAVPPEPTTLHVTEIFYSVQGEGPLAGTPAVFLRLTGCNLDCYFCDSKYAWKKDQIITNRMTIEQIVEKIVSFDSAKYLVVTGGEPLLQQHKLVDLFRALSFIAREDPWHITFETNGTITPSMEIIRYTNLFMVSPKTQFVDKAVLNEWWTTRSYTFTDKKIYFKFVIDHGVNLYQVTTFMSQYPDVRHERIFLMPQGVTSADLMGRLPMLIKFAKKYHVKVTSRMHILAYGNKRGV